MRHSRLLLPLAFLIPSHLTAQRPTSGPRFEITFPAARSAQPLDGRLLLLISTDTTDEPRFQINDTPGTQQVFGVDVEGWRPGETRVVDASAFGYPVRSLAGLPGRTLPRAGADQPLRDVSPQRRPHGEAAARQVGRAAVGAQAGQPVFDAAARSRSIRAERRDPPRPRPGDSAGRRLREAGDQVRQVRAHPQRAPLEVLGTRHVPRPRGCCCRGDSTSIPTRATRSWSTTATSRRVSTAGGRRRRTPTSSPTTAQRFHLRRLQPHPAGAGVAVLQGLDRARVPARAADRDPARRRRSTTTRTP